MLKLANVDYTKLNIPLEKMTVIVDDNQPIENRYLLYQQLLKQLQESGLSEKAEDVDKLYQKLKLKENNHYIINLFSQYWWDYGYKKPLVIVNSMFIFLMFLFVNCCFYNSLTLVYYPNHIKEYERKINTIPSTPYSKDLKFRFFKLLSITLYTSFIFWRVKLELHDLKIKNWVAILWILLQYTVGIVCLAYIANYIITK